ncbi:MAG: FAD-dependent oxidoreductase [Gammaproteobacteria bacterium]|nr:FAD-dependent oxidoreductase [Gammaproteobacteria bacterium]
MVSIDSLNCDVDFETDGKHFGNLNLGFSDNRHSFDNIPIPIVVIKTGKGPTLLLSAGSHGDEYEGQVILRRLIHETAVEDISGRLILLPALNYPAMLDNSRVSPLDQGNMNRCFPGIEGGPPTAAIADFVTRHLLPLCDAGIDLHSGGSNAYYLPCAFLCTSADAEITRQNLALAEAFNAPNTYVVRGEGSASGFDPIAHQNGVPFISTELHGGANVDPVATEIGFRGVKSVMQQMGIIDSCPSPVSTTQFLNGVDGSAYLSAPYSGIFAPACELGDWVRPGDLAGQLYSVEEVERPPLRLKFSTPGKILVRRNGARVRRGCNAPGNRPRYGVNPVPGPPSSKYSIFSLAAKAGCDTHSWPQVITQRTLKSYYDIIIVGAGGHGLATANYLAKNHEITDVLVIDSGWVGGGNTARNTTIVRSDYLLPESFRLKNFALQLWDSLSQELNFNLMYSPRGYVDLAHSDGELEHFMLRANAMMLGGANASILNRQQIQEKVPTINLSDQSRFPISGALFQPEGGVVRHDAVAWGFARQASERGIHIEQNCPVTGIEVKSGKAIGIEIANGRIGAGKVLISAASATAKLAATAGIDLPLELINVQACVTEPVKPILDCVVNYNAGLSYINQSDKGELVLGGLPMAIYHQRDGGASPALKIRWRGLCKYFHSYRNCA